MDKIEFEDTYGTGVKPWEQRLKFDNSYGAIAEAMQEELNELQPIVAAMRKSSKPAGYVSGCLKPALESGLPSVIVEVSSKPNPDGDNTPIYFGPEAPN